MMTALFSKLWLALGHKWRRALKRLWPEIYTSRQALVALQAELKLLRRKDRRNEAVFSGAMTQVVNNFDRGQQEMLLQIESEHQQVLADRDARITELEGLSVRDPLTRLFNRRGLEEAFTTEVGLLRREILTDETQEHRHHPAIAAIMIDLDHFKTANDTKGHAFGDQVLQVVSEIAMGDFGRRPGDIVSRLGGDEFFVLLPRADMRYVQEQAQHFLLALRKDIRVHLIEKEFGITASIGIARVTLEADSSPKEVLKELMRLADAAAYQAKAAGRNTIRLAEDVTQWGGLESH